MTVLTPGHRTTGGSTLVEANGARMGLSELQEFFRTFDQNVYRVMAGGRAAPSVEQLEIFEQQLGCSLPSEFREFTLSPLGGLSIEVRDHLWTRPKPTAKPTWRHQFGLKIFGLSVPVPDWLDLREEILKLPEVEGDLIPFMARTGSEDRYCFDLDGQILAWSAQDGRRKPFKKGFSQLVLRELHELEQRYERSQSAALARSRKGES